MERADENRQASLGLTLFGTPSSGTSDLGTLGSMRGFTRPQRDVEWEALMGKVTKMEKTQQEVGYKVAEINLTMNAC